MAAPNLLYAKNTQYLNVILLDSNQEPVNNATAVVANLVDSTGTAVSTFPANLPLAYVTASRGKYQGILPSTFNPSVGSGYVLTVSGTAPGGVGFSRAFPIVVSA